MPAASKSQPVQAQLQSFISDYTASETRPISKNSAHAPRVVAFCESALVAADRGRTRVTSHAQRPYKGAASRVSDSDDSSPTSTLSTADESSLGDPSPSSSPASPISILPLSSFGTSSFALLDNMTMSDHRKDARMARHSHERPSTSASGARRPRNAKGLALNLPPLSQVSSPEIDNESLPSTPAFIKPLTMKSRKKPSILSLQTTSNTASAVANLSSHPLIPPPTPGMARKHAQTSPNTHSNPPNMAVSEMTLPDFQRSEDSGLATAFRRSPQRIGSVDRSTGLAIDEDEPRIKAQMASCSEGVIGGDSFDVRRSHEDAKSPTYADGPVPIYDADVYLYVEPTAEEASNFDVVINVASEVKNPFILPKANSESLNYSAPSQGEDAETPTTPKARAIQPEYIHIPWEHNTDISSDLYRLCELIDKRRHQGKKVLIHCQQGASRSASLIIAYGMYRTPTLSVNDAYQAAQQKSKWISPNMKLMYALQDFKKELDKKRPANGSVHRRGHKSPSKHSKTMSADISDSSPITPQTAPLPSQVDDSVPKSPGGPLRTRGMSTPNLNDSGLGPSSAPSTYAWQQLPGKAPEAIFDKSVAQSSIETTSQKVLQNPITPDTDLGTEFYRGSAPSTSTTPVGTAPDVLANFDFGFNSEGTSQLGTSSTQIMDDLSPSGLGMGFTASSGPRFAASQASGFETKYTASTATPTESLPKISETPLPPDPANVRMSPPSSGLASRRKGKGPPNLPSLGSSPNSSSKDSSNTARRSSIVDPLTPGALWSPRLQDMTATPSFSLPEASPAAHHPHSIPPPTSIATEESLPNLMSPRVSEFTDVFVEPPIKTNTRHEAAAQLGFVPQKVEKAVAPGAKVDPRSPSVTGEVKVARSIDEII